MVCYGLLVRGRARDGQRNEEVWLRFVDGRPLSGVTTDFLAWCCDELARARKSALLLVWDNASWHISKQVRHWIRAHNHAVKATGQGVRIISCFLPVKSTWLNPFEPKWLHDKRRVAEPARLLTARELANHVCAAFGCPHDEHLSSPEKAA